MRFTQELDHKGQPQHETTGGQIFLSMTQSIHENLYDWAKRESKRKDGKILFKTETAGTVLEVVFTNANCINLKRKINAYSGTETTMVIAAETVSLNGITHDNKWRD
ncbi:type VI secretion system tube protein TssD [Dysgonomonas sp. ZJ279]|uniref:type VI secretion system tube protein TssD n=1 Tax=Dysgonomonas sp. ZJ279 TaxID=2709796 RepID=UPI0021037428|nr:type VI secretion system tube protein TssD [Dysgonomonas sp. ZJ279]